MHLSFFRALGSYLQVFKTQIKVTVLPPDTHLLNSLKCQVKKKKNFIKKVYVYLIHVSIYTTIQTKSVFIAHTRTHHLTLTIYTLLSAVISKLHKTINKI